MKNMIGAGLVLGLALMAQPAWGATAQGAGAGEAELTQCVAMHTTGADRVLTARWMFAAIAKSRHIADLITVSDQSKKELDKGFSQLLTRLVVKDCIDQVTPLAAKDLEQAFEMVGGAMGEIAMEELMRDKNVDAAIADYTEFLSEQDFKPLMDRVEKTQGK